MKTDDADDRTKPSKLDEAMDEVTEDEEEEEEEEEDA